MCNIFLLGTEAAFAAPEMETDSDPLKSLREAYECCVLNLEPCLFCLLFPPYFWCV